jgi:hypothetical protein
VVPILFVKESIDIKRMIVLCLGFYYTSVSTTLFCCRKNVRPARTRLKSRWLEERKICYASRPVPGYLQNWHRPHSSGLRSFYPSECRSKLLAGKLQLITLAQGYNFSHYLKVTAYHTSTSVKLGPARGGSLPSDLSLGVFIIPSSYSS